MAVMDEFREERDAFLKNGTKKDRIKYFWEYYRWHVIVTVCVLVAVGSFIYSNVTRKDTALYAVFLNTYSPDEENTYSAGFAETAGIDLNEYEIIMYTSMILNF